MSASEESDYAVSAEFYDLLQAEGDRRRARRWFAAAAGRARHGIVEFGAGTGLVTEVLLESSGVPVHAVEPAPAMRTVLMSRAAVLGAGRRTRLTVHPDRAEDAGLVGAADLAVAANVVGCVEPAARRALWRTAARALVPGGVLLFDPPPTGLPDGAETLTGLGPVRLGADSYRADITRLPDRGLLRMVFDYRVERAGRAVRHVREEFPMWPADPAALAAEAAQAGLEFVASPHPELLAARRPSG
ncbi:methyltransferase family protein [Kitasatospora sp. SolWspMP-SS2h]|uniref:class I SAM-dependent methyltransferase n=1 Tax=Kitasatospora sp. SolWspMP-SS2h TaxID=1305729 RepID=UPI000DB92F55|nr:class I SAM-dependent methyltransferase [Kitasatospora sp. SolWspMP-SS2h]RAJ46817.1 methyltransferase family protein [Kitasatospora sp. SolWspMP-SS2h]